MDKRREYKYVFTNGDVVELQIYSDEKQPQLGRWHISWDFQAQD